MATTAVRCSVGLFVWDGLREPWLHAPSLSKTETNDL